MKSKLVKFDMSKLNKLVKELGAGYAVDVGIMGAKNTKIDREDTTLTNADIGYVHEFGHGVPMRSFLRMPLSVKSNQILKDVVQAGAVKKLAQGDVVGVLSDLGIACERAIGEAFATGGFGDWEPDDPRTIAAKGSSAILIDTHQLEQSIASQVVKV